MRLTVRWLIAGVVTVAAFAVPAWVCGAFLLPLVIKDGGVRWAIATAAGLALAALMALWGNWYATTEADSEPSSETSSRTTASGDVHNTISGGTVRGPVIQGRDFSGPITLGDDAGRRLPP